MAVEMSPVCIWTLSFSNWIYFSAGPAEGLGKIIQRFPQKDWEDTPFPQGIELVSLHYIS